MKITEHGTKEYKGFRYALATITAFENSKYEEVFVNGYIEIPKENLLYGLNFYENYEHLTQLDQGICGSDSSKVYNRYGFDWTVVITTLDYDANYRTVEFADQKCKNFISQITQLSPQKEINDDQEFNYHED